MQLFTALEVPTPPIQTNAFLSSVVAEGHDMLTLICEISGAIGKCRIVSVAARLLTVNIFELEKTYRSEGLPKLFYDLQVNLPPIKAPSDTGAFAYVNVISLFEEVKVKMFTPVKAKRRAAVCLVKRP